jgi:hypothetical protein
MIPQQRGRILRERAATYQINPVDDSDLADLLGQVPYSL